MISRIQKIALVTGAAQGLGFSLTKELLDQKYVVIALVRSLEAEEKLLSCNNTDLLPIRADMRDLSFPDVVHEFIKQNTEHLDLIINNAGFGATTLDLRSIRFDEFRSVLDIHCTAPLRLLARIVPFLEAAPAESLIINISSRFASIQNVVAGTVPNEISSYAYRIAKCAQNMMSACLYAEYRKKNIRVISVDPGKLKTRFGPADADTDPDIAAKDICSLVNKNELNGVFVDRFGSSIPW